VIGAVAAQNSPMDTTSPISAAATFCALLTQDRLNLPDAGPVRLRALRSSDLQPFLAYRSDPDVARFQGWAPMSPDQGAAFLAEMAAPTGWPEGEWLQLAIARSADDALVGDIGLWHEAPGEVQLGFSLACEAQGRGWAQAALRPLSELLLGLPGARCLRAVSDSRNVASLRLLARLGFAEVRREATVVKGEACTDVVFERWAA
jgi:RimJ/RimL family protein N-acetyltransferase